MSTHLSDTAFADLPLAEILQYSLKAAGFTHCTPIQAQSLPVVLDGTDVAGQAQTGTGKTVAFLLATLQELETYEPMEGREERHPRALILAPTRELAIQIAKDAEPLNKYTQYKIGLAYGGTDYQKQAEVIQNGVDILVGTPGRIIDFFKQRMFSLKKCEVVVLDEADRMFDLGFIADLRYLLRSCPPADERRNLLFSATLSTRVMEMAYDYMGSPEKIVVEADQVTADRVRQTFYYPANHEKIPLLLGLLTKHDPSRTIIFVNMKRESERVWGYLEANGFKSQIISGDVRQTKRQKFLEEFRSGELPILIATDVAARGIHIDGVSHVINFDLPDDAEDYVHRIGRTARAGAEGDAISFVCETYAFNLAAIETYIEKKAPYQNTPADILVEPKPRIRIQREDRPSRRNSSSGGRGAPRGGNTRGGRRDNRGNR